MFHQAVLADVYVGAGPLTMVRASSPASATTRCLLWIRILEALHQAFVGHIAWYYIIE
jgi:hypothetical protein